MPYPTQQLMRVIAMFMLLSVFPHGASAIGSCGLQKGLYKTIAQVQGTGLISPLKGKQVVIEGVVTMALQGAYNDPQYKGFWLQQHSLSNTSGKTPLHKSLTASQGIFVYHANTKVKSGQVVRVLGTVDEYQNLTELKKIQQLLICSPTNASAKALAANLPEPIDISLPVKHIIDLERFEGMRIRFQQSLIVSDLHGAGYGLGNYGQFAVSSRLHFQPTEYLSATEVLNTPGLLTARDKDYLLVDDGTTKRYPSYIPFPNQQGYSANNTLRVGDTLEKQQGAELQGVLHAYKQHYIVIPEIKTWEKQTRVIDLKIKPAPWSKVPSVDKRANTVIASMNLGNYFKRQPTADGSKSARTAQGERVTRGAKSYAGFLLQRQKIVAALSAINADIIALTELENNGYGHDSAIADLTQALNKNLSPTLHYRYVIANQKTLGHSAISVGILYRKHSVSLIGEAQVMNAHYFGKTAASNKETVKQIRRISFNDRLNRPSLMQQFNIQGERLTLVVNHLKSKGKRCLSDVRPSKLEKLQGHCNQTRVEAAKALVEFIEQQLGAVEEENVLILGDLNSYSQEDPLLALYRAGYLNLNQGPWKNNATQSFSYSHQGYLGSLDHALSSRHLLKKVRSMDAWHINSVEDSLLGYQTEQNGQNHPSIDHYGEPDERRSSDHDPIIIGLEF